MEQLYPVSGRNILDSQWSPRGDSSELRWYRSPSPRGSRSKIRVLRIFSYRLEVEAEPATAAEPAEL